MYQEFAYIYDKMMKDVDYIKWADYIETIFFPLQYRTNRYSRFSLWHW